MTMTQPSTRPAPQIEVGLGALSAQTRSGTASEMHESLAHMVDCCVAAEEAGLDSAWTSEHHFADDGYLPSPLLALTAVAARTDRIRLATNVLIAPLWDPVRLVEDAAVLDHLSDGRLMLGLGLGYREAEFAGFGLERRSRAPRLEAVVHRLRDSWTGRTVSPAITPPPLQPAGPPILLGAFADVGVRRAGRLGDGWIAPELRHPGGLRKRLALLDLDTREQPFHIALTINAFVASHAAWDTVRPGVEAVGQQYRAWMTESGDVPKIVGKTFDEEGDQQGKPPQFVAGTPEECITALLPWWETLAALPAAVVPHITLRMTFPGVPPKATYESIRLMGEEVVPALRERCPRNAAV